MPSISPKRVIYVPAGRNIWLDLVRYLHNDGVIEPVLWIGDGRHDVAAKREFPNAEVCGFRKMTLLRHVPSCAYDGAFADFWASPDLSKTRDHAIKLMDRTERLGPRRGADREAHFVQLCLWAMERIASTRADMVLMAESPHSAPTYVLYAVARFAGLETVVCSAWSLVPVATVRRDLWGADVPLSTMTLRHADERARLVARHDQAIRDYVARFANPEAYEFEPRYMKIQAGRLPTSSGVARVMQAVRNKSLEVLRWVAFFPTFAKTRLRRALRKRAVETIPDGPYVYFPLHFEPERTTNPDGGAFHDQLRALARLRALVPAHFKILVKEHPSQFNGRMRGHLGRTSRFYAAAQAIEGVHLLSETASSPVLTLGAQAVATITGTVALEAALLGRPALVFGAPWFVGCPNVVQFDETLTWSDICGGQIATRDNIEEWLLDKLHTDTLPLCINPSNEKFFSDTYAEGGAQAEWEARILADVIEAMLALDPPSV